MTEQATLYIFRGDTPTLDVPVVNEAGDPVDLTDVDIRFTAKRHDWDDDDEAIIVKYRNDYGEDGIELDAQVGLALVHIYAEDTEGLTKRTTLRWDVQTTTYDDYAVPDIRTVASGLLVVRADISRTVP